MNAGLGNSMKPSINEVYLSKKLINWMPRGWSSTLWLFFLFNLLPERRRIEKWPVVHPSIGNVWSNNLLAEEILIDVRFSTKRFSIFHSPIQVTPFPIMMEEMKKMKFYSFHIIKIKEVFFSFPSRFLYSKILTRNCWDVISFHRLFCFVLSLRSLPKIV